MCTVSFIPLQNKILLVHNRDEHCWRGKAEVPDFDNVNGYTLLFPRDVAGGTWIAASPRGDAGVLLNGAFEKHLRQPHYRKSRGMVFLDILGAGDYYLSYCQANLKDIEPFTVILLQDHRLYECRWDGHQKHISRPSISAAHIWSSATLYNNEMIAERTGWFRQWLREQPAPSVQDVLQFHLSGGTGNPHRDIRINRNNELLTVSTTILEITEQTTTMQYLDLQDDTTSARQMILSRPAISQL